jgi:hypothetical protein
VPAHRRTARDLDAQVQQVDRAWVAGGCAFAHRLIIAQRAPPVGMVFVPSGAAEVVPQNQLCVSDVIADREACPTRQRGRFG